MDSRLTNVLHEITRCMAPIGLKKALSFRAVVFALRLEGTLGVAASAPLLPM